MCTGPVLLSVCSCSAVFCEANWVLRPTVRTITKVCPPSLVKMDTFFRRHFRKKEPTPQDDMEPTPCHQRRPSVAVPTSKARRRSSVGLPSSTLTQRRRSSIQLQTGMSCPGGRTSVKTGRHSGWSRRVRRRSSTTTPSVNPRFAVRRKRTGKLRTIDTHLLGPSMLLASLIQMTEEEEEEERVEARLPRGEQQVEIRSGSDVKTVTSHPVSLHSDGDDDNGDYCSNSNSQSDSSQLSEAEQLDEQVEEEGEVSSCTGQHPSSSSTSSSTALERTTPLSSTPRRLIRAPRCLRRNSSQMFLGDTASYRRYSASVQRKRRRISTISKAGSPWPGRGLPLPNRRTSVHYVNHATVHRGPRALTALGPQDYHSHLENWSAFLL